MPWTGFLAIRRELLGILAANSEENRVHFSASAERLLERAVDQSEQYKAAGKIVPPRTLEAALSESGFTRQLTNEQLRNVSKLVGLANGATFSVPGAGKTTEALAFFFYHKRPNTKLLVVAPKNAFAAWEEQLRLCAPDVNLSIARLRGSRKDVRRIIDSQPDILLVNYQKLLNERDLVADFLATNECFMYLDESHHIKRWPPGQWGTCVLDLAHLPVRKLILTGTPLPNSKLDLLPQFRFLYPQISSDETDVVEKITPVFVRTTKAELGLEPARISNIKIEMGEQQRRLYDLLRREEAKAARRFLATSDRNLLRSLGRSAMRMLQLTSNPALLAKSSYLFPEDLRGLLLDGESPKVDFACRQALDLASKGQKCVIWTSFVENVEIIARRLRSVGADYIHGGVDAGSDDDWDTREGKIRRFHDDDEAYVLVANPAACAEGISLHTVCHHAIYVDRTYNAAQFLQSQDRIHRLGLPRGTSTYIQVLSCIDSVDDSVDARLRWKMGVMADVLNDASLNREPVTEDIDEFDFMSSEDIGDYAAHLIRAAL